ncbi:uncharacterized protein BP5553_04507 [Venustampulla echinocandica]|uniref:Uncharacterized protein n=1 Tax=Venustampulla echinocandica TaxID=2656787 RepID=A0A370TNI6_9HELO|nr:uncharacterized protein BP5553_04507 [Venustampulla echinocandica]RDL37074.1 hypothetical protein BP5553_04507 [Venustampulla echinocandica]
MLDPEEQESQIVARLHNPPSDDTELDGDDTAPSPNDLDEEHNSLRYRVDETQFVAIELESQVQESSFYRPIMRPEPGTTDDISQGFRFGLPAKPAIGRFSYGRPQKETLDRHHIDRVADSVPVHQPINIIRAEAPRPRPDSRSVAAVEKSLAQTVRPEPLTKSNSAVDLDPGTRVEDIGFNQKKKGASVVSRRPKLRQHSFSEDANTQRSKTRRHPFPEVANISQFDQSIETPTRHPDQLVNSDNHTSDVSAHLNPSLDVHFGAGLSSQPHNVARHHPGLLETGRSSTRNSFPDHVPKALETNHQSNKSRDIILHQDELPMNSRPLSRNSTRDHCPDFTHPPYLHPESQLPSQISCGTQSRPQSASNIRVAITRPLNPRDLLPQSTIDSPTRHSHHAAKVGRPTDKHHATRTLLSNSTGGKSTLWNQERAEMIARYPSFLEEVMKYKTIAEDYQAKDAYIESQEKDIEKLKRSEDELRKRSESLEAANLALEERARKCTELGSKYKEHMNKVVQCQEMLVTQAKDMRKVSSQAIATYAAHQTAYSINEAATTKITDALKAIKETRLEVDKSVADEKSLLLSTQKRTEEIAKKLKEQLSVKLVDALRTNDLLKEDLQKNLIELSREQHHSEQLHLQLSGQLKAHRELAELLRKIPVDVAHQLTGNETVLGQVLALTNITHVKLDELTTVIEDLNDHEPEPPSLLSELQASDNNKGARQECILKEFEDLKVLVHQLQGDTQAQNAFNAQISKLRESNAALEADNSGYERDLQSLARQLDEMRQDFSNCRDQLSVKSHDLAVHLALPKEDPRHVTKIQELESANSGLHDQLNSRTEDVFKIEEELRWIREELKEAGNQMQHLEKEKKELQAALTAEVGHAKRAKTVDDEKLLKLSSTTKNLRDMCADKDTQLKSIREELQKLRVENELLANNTDAHQSERALLEAQVLKIVESQERLETLCVDSDTQKRIIELGSVGDDVRKLATRVIEIRDSTDKDIETLSTAHLKLGDDIRKSEDDNASLWKQIAELQVQSNQIHMPYGNTKIPPPARYNSQVGSIQSRSQRKALQSILPPMIPNQKAAVNLPSSPTDSLSPRSQAHAEDDAILNPNLGCPKRALRTAVNRKLQSDLKSHQGSPHPTSPPQHPSSWGNLEQSCQPNEIPETQQSSPLNEIPETQLSQDTELSLWPETNFQRPQELTSKPSTRKASNRKSISSRLTCQPKESKVTTREVQDSQSQFQQRGTTLILGNGRQSTSFHDPSTKEREITTSYNDVDVGPFSRLATQERVQRPALDQTLPSSTQTMPIMRPPSAAGSTISTMSPLSDLEDRMHDLERADGHASDWGHNKGTPRSHTWTTATNPNPESQRVNSSTSQALITPGKATQAQGKQAKRSEPNHRQKLNLKSALKSNPWGPTINESSASAVKDPYEIPKLQPLLPNPTSQNKVVGQNINKGRSYKRVVEGNHGKSSTSTSIYTHHPAIPQQSPMAGVPRRNRSNRAKRQSETDASDRPSKVPRISLPIGGLVHQS